VPRSNRPRRGAREVDDDVDLSRVLAGALHTESKRDGLWSVQSISAASAAKTYTCPGCGLGIAPGTQHVVAWRADGLMGEADDIAARRHWHSHCWRIAP
jgi:hypothetical protein